MTILVLDFDGVINACSSSDDLERLAQLSGWDTMLKVDIPVHKFIEHDIRFSPELIREINAVSNHVSIVWATSWNERTALFHEFLGVNKFDWLDTSKDKGTGSWFRDKLSSALEELPENETIIWIDDDFSWAENDVKWLENQGDKIVAVPVDIGLGITRSTWEIIKKLL